METAPNNSDPKENARQKRIENREKAMDMMFGKNRHLYAGNIWGWKFSMLSLIGISAVIIFMVIGILTGNINLNNQVQEAKEAQEIKQKARDSISTQKN